MNRPTPPIQPQRRLKAQQTDHTQYVFRDHGILSLNGNRLATELSFQEIEQLIELIGPNFTISADRDEFVVHYTTTMSDEEYEAYKTEVNDRYSREYNEYIQALAKYNYEMTLWEKEQLLNEVEQTRARLEELKSKL